MSKELIQALQDITDPIAAMRREVPEGSQLDGHMAVHMAGNPEWHKRRAQQALDALAARPVADAGAAVARVQWCNGTIANAVWLKGPLPNETLLYDRAAPSARVLSDEEILQLAAKNDIGWVENDKPVYPFKSSEDDAKPYIAFAHAILAASSAQPANAAPTYDDFLNAFDCEHYEGSTEELLKLGWDAGVRFIAASSAQQVQSGDAEKAIHWFACLDKCARLLDLPDDAPIPSGVVAAVEKLVQSGDGVARDAWISEPTGPGCYWCYDPRAGMGFPPGFVELHLTPSGQLAKFEFVQLSMGFTDNRLVPIGDYKWMWMKIDRPERACTSAPTSVAYSCAKAVPGSHYSACREFCGNTEFCFNSSAAITAAGTKEGADRATTQGTGDL